MACVLRLALLLLSFLLIVKHRALPLVFLHHLYVLYSRGGRLTCDFFNFTMLFTGGGLLGHVLILQHCSRGMWLRRVGTFLLV